MLSPEKVDSEGTHKPHRHAEYYFADIIFQVENELFKVPRRNFVESKVFSGMFQLPAPTDGPEGSSDDRPIRLDGIEKSNFIQLLRVMFPLDSQSLSSKEWLSVLKLSTMWEIEDIRARAVKAIYRDRIQLECKFPPPRMLEVIRQKVGQDENMYLAAISIFTSESSENEAEELAEEMVDLGLVTPSQYKSLVDYRDKCRVRAVEVASPPHNHFTWMSPEYNWFRDNEEHNCNKGGNIYIANVQGKSMTRFWWREYMYEARRRLEKRPWGATVTSGDFFDSALRDGSHCRVCKKDLDHDFRQFTDVFASQIDDAVSQVVFENL